jgi:hypothetical protein
MDHRSSRKKKFLTFFIAMSVYSAFSSGLMIHCAHTAWGSAAVSFSIVAAALYLLAVILFVWKPDA